MVTLLAFAAGSASYLGTSRAADSERVTLRVATYNVDLGLDVSTLAREIQRHEQLGAADVLMIQEIEARPGLDGPKELAQKLGLELFYAAARPLDEGSHGLAILSRGPLVETATIPLPFYELGYRSRPRVAIAGSVVQGGQSMRIFNVHLDTRLTLDQRIAQLEPVLERATDETLVIVGGDLNTIAAAPSLLPWLPVPFPGSGQAAGLDAFMRGRGFDTPHASIGATGAVGMRLDGVFTRGFEILAIGKTRFHGLSDHAAVWVDVAAAIQRRSQ